MAYFNHAFAKLFIGTKPTQALSATQKAVSTGFLNTIGVPTVSLGNPGAPFGLGVGVFGMFSPTTYTSVTSASAEVTTGKPLILASAALYQNDKIGSFHGGYQESTKSKLINPKYISRFYKVAPCEPNPNIIHVGNTPYTDSNTGLTSKVVFAAITTAGTGYNVSATITNVTFTGGTGTGLIATITTSGAGAITSITMTNIGSGYTNGDVLVPAVGSGSPLLTFTPGTAAAITVETTASTVDGTCCKEFLCDETYDLRIDVKGSPELRYLSRNGYWNTSTYTGCCPSGCGTPVPIDSTLVFIAWANEALANRIIGPFINIVVYDETGIAWYSPGQVNLVGDKGMFDLSPGVATVTITNAGSGYTDGTYTNVSFANTVNGVKVGALATVTVAGGVVTAVTITSPGMSYAVGDILTGPLIVGGSGASFTVSSLITPTWDNYVSPGHIDGACAGMKITGAYVDTKFGDCTFYPNDYFEKEPVQIYASLVDQTGDPCEFGGLCVQTQCYPRQGNGYGEQILRDLILSESYMQNYFNTSNDLRIREVTQGYDISSAINRSSLYYRYYVQHNVPRFNNPTGVFDNDQYMLEIITTGTSTAFETLMSTWLTAAASQVALETISCGAACGGTACATITFGSYTTTGTTGVAYSDTAVAAGGTAPYAYEVTAGSLPTGLSLDSATSAITGTPTVVGVYIFQVTAIDANGCQGTLTSTITIS